MDLCGIKTISFYVEYELHHHTSIVTPLGGGVKGSENPLISLGNFCNALLLDIDILVHTVGDVLMRLNVHRCLSV